MEDTQLTVVEPISKRDQATLDEYLRNGMNATQAWMVTHPNASYDAAAVSVCRWLKKPKIQAAVQQRFIEKQMSADEAISRLSDIAKGDIGDVLDNNGLLDLREARKRGLTKLLKKIKQRTVTKIGKGVNDEDTEVTEIEFEMYNAHEAARDIVKIHNRYGDNSRRANAPALPPGYIATAPETLVRLAAELESEVAARVEKARAIDG